MKRSSPIDGASTLEKSTFLRSLSAQFVRSTNRNNYEDVAAGFFLRFSFRHQTTAEGRPTGLFVTDGLRPLQIP